MTILAHEGSTPATPTPAGFWRRGHRKLIAAVTVIVIAVGAVTTGLILRHLDHQYGPLEAGPAGGIDNSATLVGATDTRAAYLKGAGTGRVFTTIGNAGSHSVTITNIDTTDAAVRYRWAPFPDSDTTVVFGDSTPWREFPAAIPADSYLQVEITIHRPRRCVAQPLQPDGGVFYSWDLTVHWESLLGSETSSIRPSVTRDVQIC